MKLHYKSVNRGRISFASDWPIFVWYSDRVFPEYKIEVWRGTFEEVDIDDVVVSAQNYVWDYIWFNYEKRYIEQEMRK